MKFPAKIVSQVEAFKTLWMPDLELIQQVMLEYSDTVSLDKTYHCNSSMQGACMITSCVVVAIMREKFPAFKWNLVGNEGHCFVLASGEGLRILVDVTARQFGSEYDIEVRPFVKHWDQVSWYPGFWDIQCRYGGWEDAHEDFCSDCQFEDLGDYRMLVEKAKGC